MMNQERMATVGEAIDALPLRERRNKGRNRRAVAGREKMKEVEEGCLSF
jgi:hypothetical protein